jgi:5-methylcytosine-specific restriction endonuclease McrA
MAKKPKIKNVGRTKGPPARIKITRADGTVEETDSSRAVPKTARQRQKKARSRRNHVTVTYKTGEVEKIKPGKLKKRSKGDAWRKRYYAHLASPKWQALRDQVIKRDKGLCVDCKKPPRRPQVHHLTYERMGDEHLEDLVLLCNGCHMKRHGL